MAAFKLSNGEELYYEEIGNGKETVVMMHGWTSSSEIYKAPAEQLKDKARFIIYDHRGHGRSKGANHERPTMETLASDLNELVNGLGLHNIILLGWSMGAAVAMNYVRLYGCDNLKKLILCDMTPKQLNDEKWHLGLNRGTYTKENMEADKGKDFLELYKAFAINAIPRLKKVPGFLLKRGLRKKLADCDIDVLKSLAASMKLQDNRDVISKITVPVVYFYADPGSLFSPRLKDWYRKHVTTEYCDVKMPGTHMFISDDPDHFAEELERHLN